MKKEKLEIMRHSTSHLMAAAILELYPKAKFGIGPVIENGFYYDIDLPKQLSINDLPKIEKKMKELAKKNLKFERKEMTINQAMKLFKDLNQPYKIELLEDIKKYGTTIKNKKLEIKEKKQNKVSIYKLGKFIDLCRGPHVESTKEIGVFKLIKIAGAYWRGDIKNKIFHNLPHYCTFW